MKRVLHAVAPAILGLFLLTSPTEAQFLEDDVEVLFSAHAEVAGDGYGWTGERIGDITGDGVAEYIVSAPFSNAGGAASGKIYIYSGADHGLVHSRVGAPLDTLGWCVSGGGDVNGDGVPDYIAGAPAAFGGGTGRLMAFSGADHTVLHDIVSPTRDALGYDCNLAGDVDGDGLEDLIGGAIFGGGSGLGTVTVFRGSDGSPVWTVTGGTPGGLLGGSVSGLCDMTGDGVPEQVGGAFNDGPTAGGLAYVFDGADGSVVYTLTPNDSAGAFGQFFSHNAGDTNADGVCDILVGDFGDANKGRVYVFSGADGTRLRMENGEDAGDALGICRGAGDVDGDGHDDLLVGAWLDSDVANQNGRVMIVSGKNGQLRRGFTGTVALAQLGFDVAALGDITGDGLPDYLITGSDVIHVVAGTPLEANGN